MKPVGCVTPVSLDLTEFVPNGIGVACIVVCQDEAGQKWSLPANYFVSELKPYREDHPDFRRWRLDIAELIGWYERRFLYEEDYTCIFFKGLCLEESAAALNALAKTRKV